MQPVGLSGRAGRLDGGGHEVVTLTGSVAGLPVHNRRLTLDFSAGDGSVSLCRTVELRHAVYHRERHQHYLQRSRCSAAVCRRKRRNR